MVSKGDIFPLNRFLQGLSKVSFYGDPTRTYLEETTFRQPLEAIQDPKIHHLATNPTFPPLAIPLATSTTPRPPCSPHASYPLALTFPWSKSL